MKGLGWLWAYYLVVIMTAAIVAVSVDAMFHAAGPAEIMVYGAIAIGTAVVGILLAYRIDKERF